VLVALATFGSRPSQRSTGNVISVPPPATEFIIPPTKAARNIATPWRRVVLIGEETMISWRL
jgi:hypothetical protein